MFTGKIFARIEYFKCGQVSCLLVLVLVQAPSTRTVDDKWSFHLPSYFRWFLSFFEASTFQSTTLQLHNDLACNLVISNTFCCLWTTYLWKTFSLTLLMKSKFSLRPSVLVLRKKKKDSKYFIPNSSRSDYFSTIGKPEGSLACHGFKSCLV